MPYLALQTNVEIKPEIQSKLLQQLSAAVKLETGKPETYVMVSIRDKSAFIMSGKEGAAAFVDFRGIGLPPRGNEGLAKAICKILQQELSVSPDRVYLNFTDVQAAMWGWNNQTFG